MKVYQAIAAVMEELATVGIGKNKKNQQQGFQYRGIDDVMNTLAPILAKHKLLILPRYSEREVIERTNSKGTALFYVTVKGQLDLVSAEDGSKHTVETFGEAMDSGDKSTNKAMSVAYKYGAFQAFCIPTEAVDPDAETHEVSTKKPSALSKSVARDTYDNQPEDVQDALQAVAVQVKWYLAKGDVASAYDYIESQGYGADEKAAIWYLFDSKQRSALKAHADSLKKAA